MPEMKISTRALVLGTACAIAVATYAARAEEDEGVPVQSPPAVEVSAEQLADKPAAYIGLRVKVRAEIADVHTPRVFTLDEDEIGVSPDVLVLSPAGAFPKDGDFVEVTGMVRSFVRAEIERDHDWFDLAKEYDVKYSERPVIVAESVLPVDE